MGKGSRLGDRPEHGDGTRIIRSRVGARSAASPIAEAITGGCRCAERGGLVMSKGSRLGDRSRHGDGTRIIRSRIGARSAASPIAEAITGGWRCAERESRATGSPAAIGTYRLAACPGAHGQVILGGKFRRVGRVVRWGDAM